MSSTLFGNRLLVLAALSFLVPSNARSQTNSVDTASRRGMVQGTVQDTAGRPIARAVISVRPAGAVVSSDSYGFFRLPVQAGNMILEVRQIGYIPGSFSVLVPTDGATVRVSVELTPLDLTLDTIRVGALSHASPKLEMVGFFERARDRERGGGSSTFLGPEAIERRRPHKVSDLLGSIPGMRLAYTRGIAVPIGRGGHCIMNIWVDGVLIENIYTGQNAYVAQSSFVPPPQRTRNDDTRASGGIDGFLMAMEVDAVEVYPSATETPPRFEAIKNQCGTIVIWTKQ